MSVAAYCLYLPIPPDHTLQTIRTVAYSGRPSAASMSVAISTHPAAWMLRRPSLLRLAEKGD